MTLPNVDSKILDPRDTYPNAYLWEEKAKNLAKLFKENFSKYEDNPDVKKLATAGPSL